MVRLTKAEFILIIILVALVISNFWTYSEYSTISQSYGQIVQERDDLLESSQKFRNDVFHEAEDNCTAVTIAYFTNFSQNQKIISFSVPYEKYDSYHTKDHPSWDELNLTSATEYITSNETTIKYIVETIHNQTQSQEELANALLNFVQNKGHGLSIRYYPTTELKYPIETLVEMGGDCDTHSILYGTLMKNAGFKVLLLFSNETIEDQYHVAIAVHLEKPPENSLSQYDDLSLTYNGEEYYYAETTNANWRVGDLPPKLKNITFNILPL